MFNGGSMLVFHSGNNAFPEWQAYNQMIGLGWRHKHFGKSIVIEDGRPVIIPVGEGGPYFARCTYRCTGPPVWESTRSMRACRRNGWLRIWRSIAMREALRRTYRCCPMRRIPQPVFPFRLNGPFNMARGGSITPLMAIIGMTSLKCRRCPLCRI